MDVHWGRGQHSENLGPQVRAPSPPLHTHITLLTDKCIHVATENKQTSGIAFSYVYLVIFK